MVRLIFLREKEIKRYLPGDSHKHYKKSWGLLFHLGKKNANGKGSGCYDWTSLIGSDKKMLMELLPSQLQEKDILFPETKDNVIQLWSDFHELYKIISN